MADEERNEGGSYKFEPMDVSGGAKVSDIVETLKSPVQKELMKREGGRAKAKYIPHDYKDASATAGVSTGSEGTDSEGKEKDLLR